MQLPPVPTLDPALELTANALVYVYVLVIRVIVVTYLLLYCESYLKTQLVNFSKIEHKYSYLEFRHVLYTVRKAKR